MDPASLETLADAQPPGFPGACATSSPADGAPDSDGPPAGFGAAPALEAAAPAAAGAAAAKQRYTRNDCCVILSQLASQVLTRRPPGLAEECTCVAEDVAGNLEYVHAVIQSTRSSSVCRQASQGSTAGSTCTDHKLPQISEQDVERLQSIKVHWQQTSAQQPQDAGLASAQPPAIRTQQGSSPALALWSYPSGTGSSSASIWSPSTPAPNASGQLASAASDPFVQVQQQQQLMCMRMRSSTDDPASGASPLGASRSSSKQALPDDLSHLGFVCSPPRDALGDAPPPGFEGGRTPRADSRQLRTAAGGKPSQGTADAGNAAAAAASAACAALPGSQAVSCRTAAASGPKTLKLGGLQQLLQGSPAGSSVSAAQHSGGASPGSSPIKWLLQVPGFTGLLGPYVPSQLTAWLLQGQPPRGLHKSVVEAALQEPESLLVCGAVAADCSADTTPADTFFRPLGQLLAAAAAGAPYTPASASLLARGGPLPGWNGHAAESNAGDDSDGPPGLLGSGSRAFADSRSAAAASQTAQEGAGVHTARAAAAGTPTPDDDPLEEYGSRTHLSAYSKHSSFGHSTQPHRQRSIGAQSWHSNAGSAGYGSHPTASAFTAASAAAASYQQQQQQQPQQQQLQQPSLQAAGSSALPGQLSDLRVAVLRGSVPVGASAGTGSEDGTQASSPMGSAATSQRADRQGTSSRSAAHMHMAVKQYTPEADSAHELVARLLSAQDMRLSDRAALAAVAQQIGAFARRSSTDRLRLVAAGAVPALVRLLELPLVAAVGDRPHYQASLALYHLAGMTTIESDGDPVTQEAIAAAGTIQALTNLLAGAWRQGGSSGAYLATAASAGGGATFTSEQEAVAARWQQVAATALAALAPCPAVKHIMTSHGSATVARLLRLLGSKSEGCVSAALMALRKLMQPPCALETHRAVFSCGAVPMLVHTASSKVGAHCLYALRALESLVQGVPPAAAAPAAGADGSASGDAAGGGGGEAGEEEYTASNAIRQMLTHDLVPILLRLLASTSKAPLQLAACRLLSLMSAPAAGRHQQVLLQIKHFAILEFVAGEGAPRVKHSGISVVQRLMRAEVPQVAEMAVALMQGLTQARLVGRGAPSV